MSKNLKSGLHQYGAECFGRLITATIRKSVGLKGLNYYLSWPQLSSEALVFCTVFNTDMSKCQLNDTVHSTTVNMHNYAIFANHSFTGPSWCSDSFFCVRAKHSTNSMVIGRRSSNVKSRSRRPKKTLVVDVPSVTWSAAERVVRTLFLNSINAAHSLNSSEMFKSSRSS